MDRNKFVVDNIFVLNITRSNNGEFEPQTVEKYRRRNDWPMWNSNRAKLMSKKEIFGPVVHTPKGVMLC